MQQIQERNIALYIVLSIVTCGIFGIYWYICLNDEINMVSKEQNPTSGGVVFLLSLVTCGIYGIYWCYCMGKRLATAQQLAGKTPDTSLSTIYLLLSIFGLSIVAWALMQNELNTLIRTYNNYNNYNGQSRPM